MSSIEKSTFQLDISKNLLNIDDIINQDIYMKDEPYELLKSEFKLEKEEHDRTKRELDNARKQNLQLEEKICIANREYNDIVKRSHDEILKLKLEFASAKEEISQLKKQKQKISSDLAASQNIINNQKLKIKTLENRHNKELSSYQSQFTELQLEIEQERYLKKILSQNSESSKEDTKVTRDG